MDDPRSAAIRALIEPILAEHHMELVEFTSHPQGRQLQVRVLVDRVGGVTIQQCARVNRVIGDALEAAHLIEERYTIEVSSPGLDRPLVSARDFERALGEDLELELMTEDDRKRLTSGILLAVQPDAIVLKMSDGNVTVPMRQIRRAQKALHW